MKKDILIYPKDKEILTQKSENINEINDEIKQLSQDLIDTLKSTETGVGISAIQIGVPKKMCIIKYNGQYITLINPVITKTRGEINFQEGCLSTPDLIIPTVRAQKVWCEYTDLNGKKQELANGGLCSVIIQHELDHFNGECKLFSRLGE